MYLVLEQFLLHQHTNLQTLSIVIFCCEEQSTRRNWEFLFKEVYDWDRMWSKNNLTERTFNFKINKSIILNIFKNNFLRSSSLFINFEIKNFFRWIILWLLSLPIIIFLKLKFSIPSRRLLLTAEYYDGQDLQVGMLAKKKLF